MTQQRFNPERRQFLKTALHAGTALALPLAIPGSVLGKDGAVPPSEQIVMGGIGIGNRGTYDLTEFLKEPVVRFVAICDVKSARRQAVKKMADTKYRNQNCDMYRDMRELLVRDDIDAVLIATGPNWHAMASTLAAKAGKDVYCEKPCTKNIAQSLALAETFRRTARVFQAGTQRRSLPHFQFAIELARTGKLGKLQSVHAHPSAWEERIGPSGWESPETLPPQEELDWDLYLGPAPWRPYNRAFLVGGEFEKGGGLVGGGILEWGSHTVDLCQCAADADHTAPVKYEPMVNTQSVAYYASGVKLVNRTQGWLGLGSCPVRFEGDAGWVETGDSGKIVYSSPALLGGKKIPQYGGYPISFHVRDFLDCIKTRGRTRGNADAACQSHIACHAANIATLLGRTVNYDPQKNEFIGDDEANRLRSEAQREPWHV